MKKIRDAQTIIGMLEGGDTAAALGQEMTDTLAKLREMAGPKRKVKGSVTAKFDFVVEGSIVAITCDITSKTPKEGRVSSMYWVLEDGSLSTEHPQQTDMFSGPREARTAE